MNNHSVVIIGGFPWAGTRQFADFMNGSGLFDIRGEVYNKSFNHLASLFSVCDTEHVGKWSEKNYRKWRHLSVLNSLAGISKGYNQPYVNDGIVQGFKCPWIERNKDSLDILFEDVDIDFFVCLRSLSQNILSGVNRFGVSVDYYEKNVKKSVENIEAMVMDPRYRVHFLNLDDFISSEDKSLWLMSNLFSLDSIKDALKREQVQEIVNSTPNRNSSKGRMGKDRPKVLDEDLQERVFNSDVLKKSFDKLEKMSGACLWK